MNIKVLVFAHLREIVGSEEISLDLEEGSKGDDILHKLEEKYPEMTGHKKYLKLSMNGEYIGREDLVVEGAEIAVFPPVSGG
ncbi:MAG: MoaD/ThiS family protein [Proteobacteria bacterium]|nr:MoaD/ThiS family protein [Pseudomonadota bacterium]